MLSLLPEILFLGAFSASLIRVVVAIMLAYNAWQSIARPGFLARMLAVVEIVIAAALFVGAWTQVVAIIACVVLVFLMIRPDLRSWPRSTVALLLVMTITLIVTGPGAFAFDLPL
jgi:hypothetical protein